jgi:hypothetical protein
MVSARGSIQGLLDGIELKQTVYALDHDSPPAALARFVKRGLYGGPEEIEEERRLAAQACVYSQITTADQATFDVRYGFENGANATDVAGE